MIRYVTFGVLAFAALLGIGFPTAADHSRPFRGSGYEIITGANGNVLTTDGEGHATHLGRFTRHLVVTINEDLSLDGHLVFTAANGDKLFAHLTGDFVTLTGDYTITGGTGRFANASGSAEFSASNNAGVLSFSFDGRINY